MSDLRQLEEKLQVEFHDYGLIERALTHSSFINETSDVRAVDNERLEFLGDAVLDFVVGAYLYDCFPDKNEGELTALRAALVRTSTLANFARQLELGTYIRLGYGESESGGRNRRAILCATFEAVVGAIYLDLGLTTVQTFMEPLLAPTLTVILNESLHKDAKSEFQVWAQATHNLTPSYNVIKEEGPDHEKTFTLHVMMGDEVWGEGIGRNKREAAQAAAAQAMGRVAQEA